MLFFALGAAWRIWASTSMIFPSLMVQRHVVRTLIGAAVLAGLAPYARADADQRVASLLRQEGFKYLIDQDEDFLITFETGSNKTQQVWVNSHTSRFDTIEIREIWAVAYTAEKPLVKEQTEAFLKRNSVIKIGGWSVAKGKADSAVVVFRVQVDAATQTASSLRSILEFVAVTASGVADEMKSNRLWSPF